jgi:hypothetical protein
LGIALGILARLSSVTARACLAFSAARSEFLSSAATRFADLAFGSSGFGARLRFHLCSLPLGGLCVVSQRRCAYLFKLGLLGLGRRLQALRETWFFTSHVFDPSFYAASRRPGRNMMTSILIVIAI